MTTLYRKTYAQIRLAHLQKNLEILRHHSQQSFVCPMIKSNAYGHGMLRVAKYLEQLGEKTLGVALVEEAQMLREHGVLKSDILVFGDFTKTAVKVISELKLTPVISRMDILQSFVDNLPSGANFPIHLKFNTGMNRLGFSVTESSQILRKLGEQNQIKVTGLCSHLACAEDFDDPEGVTAQQISICQSLSAEWKQITPLFHLFNSTAALKSRGKKNNNFGIRPGISMYGANDDVKNTELHPVMTLISEIVAIHKIKDGDSVSYGHQWTAQRPSVIGVVAIGYGDGYPRHLSNRGQMIFKDKLVPVVGRVCMDYTLIDLTDAIDLTGDLNRFVGSEVILFGSSSSMTLPVETVAHTIGTISYEILTRVSERVPRVYIE